MIEPEMKPFKQWKTIRTKLIVGFQVKSVRLPTGKEVDYLVLDHPSSVGIIALEKENMVVMVGQYRYATDEFSWEIPAGILEPGETLEEGAKRELKEETRYLASKIEPIGSFYPSNAASNEVVHLVLATGLEPDSIAFKANEPIEELIEVTKIPLDMVMEKIVRNEIKDATTIIGLLLASSLKRI